ncbi:signal peptidase I [Halomicrobium salinisoli]|uniref:signal peptidase I n=1 Tax=Halomicrobium salinisoli TaxID=2878391 RepID=UPI001CF0CA56|nr:signal peptidase I [Halomicrobium salinisoli]
MSDRHRRETWARRRRDGDRVLTAGRVAAALLVVLAAAGLAMPVTPISYVDSGSMAPALSPGDGFLAVPAAVTGPPEVGDVVVYRSEGVDPGGLVVHRVVDRTSEGYVTRGDANPVTDQRAGEPPVGRDRVVAHAVAVDGDVVALPGVGHVATRLDWLRSAFGG